MSRRKPEFRGHAILNRVGDTIYISLNTLRELDKRKYLVRDRKTGLKKLTHWDLFVLAEYGSPHYHELGAECKGPSVVFCDCPQCNPGRVSVEPQSEKGR